MMTRRRTTITTVTITTRTITTTARAVRLRRRHARPHEAVAPVPRAPLPRGRQAATREMAGTVVRTAAAAAAAAATSLAPVTRRARADRPSDLARLRSARVGQRRMSTPEAPRSREPEAAPRSVGEAGVAPGVAPGVARLPKALRTVTTTRTTRTPAHPAPTVAMRASPRRSARPRLPVGAPSAHLPRPVASPVVGTTRRRTLA